MYHKSKNFYFAPEGAGGGGAATNPPTPDPKSDGENDPFKQIDLDNLDDKSKKALETIQTNFATLQKATEQTQQQVRQFQSEKDKAVAELNRVRSAIQDPRQTQVDPQKAFASQVEALMVDNGVTPEAAKAQAPIMAKLLEAQRAAIMQEVGQGLQPVVSNVYAQQAENAYNIAKSLDKTGAFAIPEVAQAIWDSCQQIAAERTQITPDTVKNLKAMHYLNHIEKNGGNFATLQNNPGVPAVHPPMINTGGFSYPGAQFHPTTPAAQDPNAARTVLDPGTRAALQSIFGQMKPGHQVK